MGGNKRCRSLVLRGILLVFGLLAVPFSLVRAEEEWTVELNSTEFLQEQPVSPERLRNIEAEIDPSIIVIRDNREVRLRLVYHELKYRVSYTIKRGEKPTKTTRVMTCLELRSPDDPNYRWSWWYTEDWLGIFRPRVFASATKGNFWVAEVCHIGLGIYELGSSNEQMVSLREALSRLVPPKGAASEHILRPGGLGVHPDATRDPSVLNALFHGYQVESATREQGSLKVVLKDFTPGASGKPDANHVFLFNEGRWMYISSTEPSAKPALASPVATPARAKELVPNPEPLRPRGGCAVAPDAGGGSGAASPGALAYWLGGLGVLLAAGVVVAILRRRRKAA